MKLLTSDGALRLDAPTASGKGMKSIRECVWTYDLDMLTLVSTRGRDFPLSDISSRLAAPSADRAG